MRFYSNIFISILLTICFSPTVDAQIQYGSNFAAGHYFNVGDANIYYEEYGTGPTIILMHGGIYGYIDEFSSLISSLSKNHHIIALATRGHGRSELGHRPLSYELFAEDAFKVISHVASDSVTIIGFSDGADAGYYLAAKHPEKIKKLIAIGGNFGYLDFKGSDKKFIDELNVKSLYKNDSSFVAERKGIMPEPNRFDEFIKSMAMLWRTPEYVNKKTIASIIAPTLIIAGQNDGCPIEKYVALYRLLSNGQIAIIPLSDHLVLIRQPALTEQVVSLFLEK